MAFEGIMGTLEALLGGWQDGDDDSKTFFGDLVESGSI